MSTNQELETFKKNASMVALGYAREYGLNPAVAESILTEMGLDPKAEQVKSTVTVEFDLVYTNGDGACSDAFNRLLDLEKELEAVVSVRVVSAT